MPAGFTVTQYSNSTDTAVPARPWYHMSGLYKSNAAALSQKFPDFPMYPVGTECVCIHGNPNHIAWEACRKVAFDTGDGKYDSVNTSPDAAGAIFVLLVVQRETEIRGADGRLCGTFPLQRGVFSYHVPPGTTEMSFDVPVWEYTKWSYERCIKADTPPKSWCCDLRTHVKIWCALWEWPEAAKPQRGQVRVRAKESYVNVTVPEMQAIPKDMIRSYTSPGLIQHGGLSVDPESASGMKDSAINFVADPEHCKSPGTDVVPNEIPADEIPINREDPGKRSGAVHRGPGVTDPVAGSEVLRRFWSSSDRKRRPRA